MDRSVCGQVRREALLLLATQINAGQGDFGFCLFPHPSPPVVCVCPCDEVNYGGWRELLGNQSCPPPACGTLLSQLIKKKVFSVWWWHVWMWQRDCHNSSGFVAGWVFLCVSMGFVVCFLGGFLSIWLVGWLFGSFFFVLFWLICVFFFLGNCSRVFQKSQDFPDHLLSHLLFYFSFPEMIFLSAKLLGCGTQPGSGTSTLRLLEPK